MQESIMQQDQNEKNEDQNTDENTSQETYGEQNTTGMSKNYNQITPDVAN